jgi:hypothetical protein
VTTRRFRPSPDQLPMFFVCCVCNCPVAFTTALRFQPKADPFNWPLHRACAELDRRSWPSVMAAHAEAAR